MHQINHRTPFHNFLSRPPISKGYVYFRRNLTSYWVSLLSGFKTKADFSRLNQIISDAVFLSTNDTQLSRTVTLHQSTPAVPSLTLVIFVFHVVCRFTKDISQIEYIWMHIPNCKIFSPIIHFLRVVQLAIQLKNTPLCTPYGVISHTTVCGWIAQCIRFVTSNTVPFRHHTFSTTVMIVILRWF